MARKTFGDGMVDFYVKHARIEAAAFDASAPEWALQRYFERI
jgi:glutamine synthetase